MSKFKTTFRKLAERNTGAVCFQFYKVKGEEKNFAFSPIEPKASSIKCESCGLSTWNATNFACPIHFCPDRELTVEITDYKASLRGF